MKAATVWRQGMAISRDEWRLQRRSWGTWLVGLFFLAFVISEHITFGGMPGLSVAEAASNWADRVMVIGSFVAILTVPFTLDRARRERIAPVEFSKPFDQLAYVSGKFVGAIAPLVFVTFLSLVIHFGITWLAIPDVSLASAGTTYLNQAVFLALVPLLYAASLIYCLSVYISRPVLIIPLYLFYLQMSSLTQAAANARFSWWSPLVRPDYYSYEIPVEMTSTIWAHQALYLFLSVIAFVLAGYGFQRRRYVDGQRSLPWWRQFHFPLPTRLGARLRILWGGQMVAALIMAFFAIMNTLGNPQTDPALLAEYALFGLEFWLAISGLLILAGVVVRDKGAGTLDLVLTKPVNRWRLLAERLLPALAVYFSFCVFSVFVLRIFYEQLPILKALLVAISTGLYLGCVGMTAANIARNELAGYGAGLLYWLFEAGLDGRFTAPFFLFIVSNQVDNANLELWDSPWIWLPVKLGSILLSAWLYLLNGWLLDSGPARRRALGVLVVSIPVIFVLGWWLMPRLGP